jgi:hypothetical protein
MSLDPPAPAVPAVPVGPVATIGAAITKMQAIDAQLKPEDPLGFKDGLYCFNNMYLQVTQQVNADLERNFYHDPDFMTALDVTFANLYFAAYDVADTPAQVPPAWRPLVEQRDNHDIEDIQFALAGMNAHINHDLPKAVVDTCVKLTTAPDDGSHHADYQKVDQLLDNAEQAIRQSLETRIEQAVDDHLKAVATLTCNWCMNSARDVAWDNSLLLWAIRDVSLAQTLFLDGLARTTAMASRLLLVAV